MAAKRLTLERKTTRTSFEDLPVAYSKTQARCQSDYNQPRYNELNVLSWQEMSRQLRSFFKMAAKWLALERKTTRTSFEELNFVYATSPST